MATIKQVCSYCGKEYGSKDGDGKSGISHGICPKCLELSDDELDALASKKPAAKTFREFVEQARKK